MKVWIDGVISDPETATVSALDHGLLYGDGVFEGMRVFGGKVFRLDLHLARLRAGASYCMLDIPGGSDGVKTAIRETLAALGSSDAYIRLIVTRGTGPLGVDPMTCETPRVLCMAANLSLYPAEKLAQGLSIMTSSYRRPAADALEPRVKSLNYLNNALAKLEARKRGADEALLLNNQGRIAEAAVANVFAVRDGVVLTPPGVDGALEGITRRTVMDLAQERNIPVQERSLTRLDLLAASEVFLTGSGAGIVPVCQLDDRAIGAGVPGQVFAELLSAYRDAAPRYGVSL